MISVAVVGDIMIDRYTHGTCKRISPEAPVPVVNVITSENLPGGAANTANQVGALEAESCLFGYCEPNLNWDNFEIHNIDVPFTIVKERVVVNNHQMIRVDRDDSYSMSQEYVDKFIDMLFSHSHYLLSDAVIISDYCKGTINREIARNIVNLWTSYTPIIVDTKRQSLEWYRGATVITPNQQEWENMKSHPKFDEYIKEINYTILTKGRYGLELINNIDKTKITVPSYARHVFDVTGAGDVLVGTLAVALANGQSIESAARIANIAAGLAVEEPGTTVVDKQALRQRIQISNGGIEKCPDIQSLSFLADQKSNSTMRQSSQVMQ
jgi:D-beta-D-heptose 7-phosphate kinase/D-beta-D-heptose 1-phosphate adenosyltransferase